MGRGVKSDFRGHGRVTNAARSLILAPGVVARGAGWHRSEGSMEQIYALFIVGLFSSVVVTAAFALFAWRRRESPVTRAFFWASVTVLLRGAPSVLSAVSATPEQAAFWFITVRYVGVALTPQPDGFVRFWVRDSGPGLSVEQQGRLFTEFTRLHKVKAEGHGLGLSIVQRIVHRLGGQVGVESAEGRGSTFYFTLRGG